MSKNDSTTTKQPKTIALGVYIRDIILAAVFAGIVGLIGGYFASIELHSQAREQVTADQAAAVEVTSPKQ